MSHTDSLEIYTISVLRSGERFLLLERNAAKKLFPSRWSGLGGKVEPHELERIRASALREVEEEAGIPAGEIARYSLRRVLLVSRPRQALRLLFYFTGEIDRVEAPPCSEGTLHWVRSEDFERLDIIETTRPVLALLAADMARDPEGGELPRVGLSVFSAAGAFRRIVWEDA